MRNKIAHWWINFGINVIANGQYKEQVTELVDEGWKQWRKNRMARL